MTESEVKKKKIERRKIIFQRERGRQKELQKIVYRKYIGSGQVPCGQSYEGSTIVIYDSRVVPDQKIPHITTLDS